MNKKGSTFSTIGTLILILAVVIIFVIAITYLEPAKEAILNLL